MAWTSSLFSTAGVTVVAFLATPYLLEWLGPERLGATRTTEQLLGYMLIFYAGLGAAYSVKILRALSRNERSLAEALVLSSRHAQFRLSLLLLPVGLILSLVAWPLVINSSAIPRHELVGAATVLVTVSILLFPLSAYRDLLECEQRSYWVHAALLAQAILVAALALAFARGRFELPGQFGAMLLGLGFYYAILIAASGGWRHFFKRTGSVSGLPVTWHERWPLAVTAVGNRVNLMTDAITVSVLFGPLVVTDFTITQRLVLTGVGLISGVSNVVWAPLGALIHRGEIDRVRLRLGDLIVVITGGGLLTAALLAAYNSRFVALWVGPKHYGGDGLTIATSCQAVVFGFFLLFAWILDSQGQSRGRVVVSTLGACLNLGLSFILGKRLGPLGVCVATPIAYLVTDAWFCPWLFSQRFGLFASDVLRPLARSLAAGLPWALSVWHLAHRSLNGRDSWLALSTELLTLSLLMALYFAVVVCPRRLRIEAITTVRNRLFHRTL